MLTDTIAVLHRAICSEPSNDSFRLICADCLDDEAGEPTERAEFIRVQVELAKMLTFDQFLARLRSLNLRGTFEDDEEAIYWMADFETADGEEPHDIAWEINCDVANQVAEIMPDGWERECSWSDNDSVGWTLKPTERHRALRKRERELLWSRKPQGLNNGILWLGFSPRTAQMKGESASGTSVAFGLRSKRLLDAEVTYSRGFPSHVTLSEADFLLHAKSLAEACPLTEVVLSNKRPMHWSGGVYWEPGYSHDAPHQISFNFDAYLHATFHGGLMCYEFDTEEAALAALSAACVRLARQRAGLEKPTGELS